MDGHEVNEGGLNPKLDSNTEFINEAKPNDQCLGNLDQNQQDMEINMRADVDKGKSYVDTQFCAPMSPMESASFRSSSGQKERSESISLVKLIPSSMSAQGFIHQIQDMNIYSSRFLTKISFHNLSLLQFSTFESLNFSSPLLSQQWIHFPSGSQSHQVCNLGTWI